MQNEKAAPCKKQKSCKQKAVLSHPDMNPHAPERKEDWKVYFNGSLWGHHDRERAGREVSVQKWFQWAGRDWFVPSVYVCAVGEAAQGKLRTACSALRFAAADHADWRVGFRETPWEEGTFGLI